MSSKIIHAEEDSFAAHSWQRIRGCPGPAPSPPDGGAFSPPPAGGADPQARSSRASDNEELHAALARECEARLQQERSAAFEAGRKAAQDASRQELQAHYDRLAQSIGELSVCRARYRKETESEVVQLALAIAKRILRRELSIDPEAILGLLRAGLDSVSLREVLEIRVNPAHVEVVRTALHRMGAPAAISVVGDAHLEPGAVCVETRRGGFDASAETQLDEIQRGFADLMVRSANP